MHFESYYTFHLGVCEKNLLLTALQILNSWSTGTPFSHWDFPDLVDLSILLKCYVLYIYIFILFIFYQTSLQIWHSRVAGIVSRSPPPFSHWDFPGLTSLSTTITHTYISILLFHRINYCHAIMHISIVLDHALYFP